MVEKGDHSHGLKARKLKKFKSTFMIHLKNLTWHSNSTDCQKVSFSLRKEFLNSSLFLVTGHLFLDEEWKSSWSRENQSYPRFLNKIRKQPTIVQRRRCKYSQRFSEILRTFQRLPTITWSIDRIYISRFIWTLFPFNLAGTKSNGDEQLKKIAEEIFKSGGTVTPHALTVWRPYNLSEM